MRPILPFLTIALVLVAEIRNANGTTIHAQSATNTQPLEFMILVSSEQFRGEPVNVPGCRSTTIDRIIHLDIGVTLVMLNRQDSGSIRHQANFLYIPNIINENFNVTLRGGHRTKMEFFNHNSTPFQ